MADFITRHIVRRKNLTVAESRGSATFLPREAARKLCMQSADLQTQSIAMALAQKFDGVA